MSSDYVHEIIGQRSHLVIEDEQRICSQVKQIRNEEENAKQAEIAKFNATKAAGLAEAARVELENHQWLADRVFGTEKWNKYFGDVGAEPPLPPNIREILLAPCPIWPGKCVEQTHKLVLVPENVKGAPLTLTLLERLIKAPKKGLSTKLIFYDDCLKQEHGNTPCRRSHWVLMTRDVIP